MNFKLRTERSYNDTSPQDVLDLTQKPNNHLLRKRIHYNLRRGWCLKLAISGFLKSVKSHKVKQIGSLAFVLNIQIYTRI